MELDRPVEDVHEIFRGEFETTGVDDDIGDEAAYEADVGTNEGGALFADNIQLQTTPKGKGSSVQATVSTPAVGMTYESWEQIDLHFRCYAKQHGFAVCRVGSGVRQRNGVITKVKRNVIWKCENWGENKSDSNQVAINVPEVNVPNTRSRAAKKKADDNAVQKRQSSAGYEGVRVAEGKSKKCNCPIMLYANSSVDGSVWTIKKVILQHEGHEPTPSKSRSISAYRKEEWNPAIRRRLFNDLESGIKLPQIHRGMARERGGIENFALTQRDMRNEVTKKRNKDMEGGDAAAMYRYLRRMAEDNDLFFYEYRLDEFQRLKDVMWVDARSRAAFEYFGDVVCFDTTYITNEFELPFANFVGVNHHGQTILLGCALLAHEDSESFEWLFTTWLRCMGKAPDGILTDQDAAMKKALANAMPDVRHRWCLWHILKKFYTKLGSYEHYEKLSEALQNAIYDCLTPEEFEANWTSIVNKYNLSCDDWLEGTFAQYWLFQYG